MISRIRGVEIALNIRCGAKSRRGNGVRFVSRSIRVGYVYNIFHFWGILEGV